MFFGRRKHAAPAPAGPESTGPVPAVPDLTDELIFAAVQSTLQSVFGDDGEWTVARRSDDQTDQIFHEVLVHSLATAVTASVSAARIVNAVDDPTAGGPLGLLRAPRTNPWVTGASVSDADAAGIELDDEAAAFSWEPAPITRWADLKRPVTGPVAIARRSATESEEKAA